MESGVQSCLKLESVAAFLSGRLEGPAAVTFEAHVARCTECRELLSAVARSDSTRTAVAETSASGFSSARGTPSSPFHSMHPTLPRFQSDEAARVGPRIGRYILRRPLAAGGMGVVYEAYDPELDRRIAIKLLRDDTAGPDASSLQERLQREARVMARLAHPNVVAVYDAGAYGDRTFVAMELVVGQTLTAWLAAARRRVAEVVSVFTAAGRGLAAAHSAGIVHRDFKPENVLIGDDGRVRVTDFGLAQPVSARAGAPGRPPAGEDAMPSRGAPTVAGTPYYMAPEQAAGGMADERADQFSFCVALFAALTDEHPMGAAGGTAAASLGGTWRISRHPRIPRWLWPTLRTGLARSPADRHRSMTHLLRALSSASRGRWLRRAIWCAAPAALLLGAVVTVHGGSALPPECRGAAGAIGRVWNSERARAVERALRGRGGRGKAAFVDHVVSSLDGHARSWVSMREEACAATRTRHEQSESLLVLRNRCLDARASELEHLVDRLAGGGVERVEDAAVAIQSLGSLGTCADSDALLDAARNVVPPIHIAATQDAAGAPALFLRRSGGELWHLSPSAPDRWRSVLLVRGAAGRPAAFARGDTLTYAVRRGDGSLWRGRRVAGSSAWEGAPIAGGLAGDPAVLLVAGQPTYFVRMADGWLWRGGDGDAGRSVWGERVEAHVSGSAAVWLEADNRVNYIARRADGTLRVSWQETQNGDAWQSHKLAEQVIGDPHVAVDAKGQLTWFARRSDGLLLHGYQAGAGSGLWHMVALVDGIAGDPAVVLDGEGRLVCFARKSDGSLWQGRQYAPAAGPWQGGTVATGVTSDPAAIATGEGLMYFVGRADGSVWQGVQEEPDGAWFESKILEGEEKP